MGVAAYQRGNALIRKQGEESARLPEFAVIESLNSMQKLDTATAPWGPVRFIQGHGGWWAECPKTGFGYWYPTIREAVKRWSVTITSLDITAHGPVYWAEPR